VGKREFILVSRILIDNRECSHAKVDTMSKSIAKTRMETPITVTFDGKNYRLKDGYYRLAAVKVLGQTHIYAKVED
jgi:hypothetical protein